MSQTIGRPYRLSFRASATERFAFEEAAANAGYLSLSEWVRRTLREATTLQLHAVGKPNPFFQNANGDQP